jgi:hypothetical protein
MKHILYHYVAKFVTGLIKNIQLSAAIKRNALIMKNLYDQAHANGIVEITVPQRDR